MARAASVLLPPQTMLRARGGCSNSGSIPYPWNTVFWRASLPQGRSILGSIPGPGLPTRQLGAGRHTAPPGSRVLAPVAASPPEQPGTIAHCGDGFQARPGNGSSASRRGGKAFGGAGKLLLDGVQRPRSSGREPAAESKQHAEHKVLTPKGSPGTPGTTPGTASPRRVNRARASKSLPAALNLIILV